MVQVAQTCVARGVLLDAARVMKFLWEFGHLRAGLYEEAEEACDRRGQPVGVNKRFLSACLQYVELQDCGCVQRAGSQCYVATGGIT